MCTLSSRYIKNLSHWLLHEQPFHPLFPGILDNLFDLPAGNRPAQTLVLAGVEGRISVLKRRNELDRCRDHGQAGFEKWVGWGVIAGNLLVIGRAVAATA